jgi:hypothetical protein
MGYTLNFFAPFCFFGVALSTASVPLFLWTGKSYFSSRHVELSKPFLLEDIQYTFSYMLQNHDLEAQGAPEVLVAFVAEKLGSSDIPQMSAAFGGKDQLVNLKEALSSARNSLTIPYLYPNQKTMSKSLVESLTVTSPSGRTINSNLATETCSSVVSKLESAQNIFYNGVTDLILVAFSDYEGQQVDQCLQQVNTYVQNHANQKYIALLSADAARVEPQLTFSNEKLLENDIVAYSLLSQPATPVNFNTKKLFAQNGTNSTAPVFIGPQYISPAILFGILLGFVLIFFLWQGVYQLTLIEAPVRFSHTTVQLGL